MDCLNANVTTSNIAISKEKKRKGAISWTSENQDWTIKRVLVLQKWELASWNRNEGIQVLLIKINQFKCMHRRYKITRLNEQVLLWSVAYRKAVQQADIEMNILKQQAHIKPLKSAYGSKNPLAYAVFASQHLSRRRRKQTPSPTSENKSCLVCLSPDPLETSVVNIGATEDRLQKLTIPEHAF